jgi:hypothetical protein
MNIKKITRKFFKALRIMDAETLRKAGDDTRYASERRVQGRKEQQASDRLVEVSTAAIRCRQRAKDAEAKLEAAAEAFRKIDCLTADLMATRAKEANKIAIEARRAATA